MINSFKNRVDSIRYKVERIRYDWKDLLCAELSARMTRRFPRVSYWITLTVGVRNIRGNEVVPDVPFMDVLNRQYLKAKGIGPETI